MACNLVHLSNLKVKKYYNLVSIDYNNKVKYICKMGKLLDIQLYGRNYDPDVDLLFQKEDGETFRFQADFSPSYGFTEYNMEESEDIVRERVQTRTHSLKSEILGNDWALSPENVVAIQGIDTSMYLQE